MSEVDVRVCDNCGADSREDYVYFSWALGQWVCQHCADKLIAPPQNFT